MTSATSHFDLIVIGGGPAGVIGASTAALAGKSVALVHARRSGAVRESTAKTVPSKTLREAALTITGMNSGRPVGHAIGPNARGGSAIDALYGVSRREIGHIQ